NVKPTVLPQWPGWLKALAGLVLAVRESDPANGYWSLDRWEVLLEAAGVAKDTPARFVLDPQHTNTLTEVRGTYAGYIYYGDRILEQAGGWPAHLARYPGTVRELLHNGDATARTHALRTLLDLQYDFSPVQDLVVEIACGSAKTPREVALIALEKIAASAPPLLEKTLQSGDASQRHEAVTALWRLLGQDARATLEQHAAGESSERVKQ